ncbi:MAG: hypothetical protein AABZ55_09520, partial [Bdellovibrionota bacterium]
AYPSDLTGLIYLQNQISSPVGNGWRISGYSKIVNPDDDRIFLEEADGAVSGYGVENQISTIFDVSQTDGDLSLGHDLSKLPNLTLTAKESMSVISGDISAPNSFQVLGTIPHLGGRLSTSYFQYIPPTFFFPFCARWYVDYTFNSKPSQLVQYNGLIYFSDEARGAIYSLDEQLAGPTNEVQLAAGRFLNAPVWPDVGIIVAGQESPPLSSIKNFCADNNISISCGALTYTGDIHVDPRPPRCIVNSSGLVPNTEFQADGNLPTTLKNPGGITGGRTPNTFVVADTGHHVVRLYDLNNNSVTTIAGNVSKIGKTGDGGLATDAALFHPRGVLYDSVGNLYISTEDGSVRKVDTSGRISTLVGNADAFLQDKGYGPSVLLNNPFGMAIDQNHGFLYIADTNNHVIRRLDLSTLQLVTVAGNLSPGFAGDGGPALNAQFKSPTQVSVDADGNLIVSDSGNQRIRKIVFQNFAGGVVTFGPVSKDRSKLSRLANGTFKREYRNGKFDEFDIDGLQTSSTDRVGRKTTFTYDRAAQSANDKGRKLTAMADPTGRSIIYNYSGGRLSSVTDPAGRNTQFSFDGSGGISSVTYPDGSSRGFTYQDGLMTA